MIDRLPIQENVSLAPLTTLEVGGPARFFILAQSEEQIADAFSLAKRKGLEIFILGGGSNVLVSDKGFDGLVIKIALRGILHNNDVVSAAAGEDWDSFVAYCVTENLAGLECLSGIPGTVGGTPVQNVGAYGQEVSETIDSVRCYDRETGEITDLSTEECGFKYRVSIFNSTAIGRYVVLSVSYRFAKNGPPKIAYKDLADYFQSREPSLAETREAVLSVRRSKSMVIDMADPNHRSAGSFFKNPIVGLEKFESIAADYSDQKVPHFPAETGSVKIPAAWLIENAGFHKGYQLGAAGVSTNHTLAIVNRGGASATEIIGLKNSIQAAVYSKFGISLLPEPVFVGDF